MENNEKVFADGFLLKAPHENAMDFVKGSLSIKADEAIKFIEDNKDERGWVNLDLKESKGGKWYCEKNTWKPPQDGQSKVADTSVEYPADEIDPIDVPF